VSITPETLAWLRQTAKFEGGVTAQVLLHLLERVEALEQRPMRRPTPEPAPVARPEGDWFAVALMAQDMRSRGLAEQIAGDELLKLANAQLGGVGGVPLAQAGQGEDLNDD
jgi:hypothetical protein